MTQYCEGTPSLYSFLFVYFQRLSMLSAMPSAAEWGWV